MRDVMFAFAGEILPEDIKRIRKKMSLTQAAFAKMLNVSVKTVERWENDGQPVTGPVVTLLKILDEYPEIREEFEIPPRYFPMRLWYMYKNEVCTVIEVNEREKRVHIFNYTRDNMKRAFGKIERPTYEQYEEFFGRMQGRMAEDDFWIKIER